MKKTYFTTVLVVTSMILGLIFSMVGSSALARIYNPSPTVSTAGFLTSPVTDADVPDTITVSNYLLLAGGTLTGGLSMTTASHSGGAEFGSFASVSNSGYLKLPWGTAPTVDANGKLAVDDSGFGQLVYYASGSAHTLTDEKTISFSMASTTYSTFTSRDLRYLFRGMTVKRIACKVSSATSVVINFEDGSNNNMDSLTCLTTQTFDDGSIANATLTKGENLTLEIGTITGEADFLEVTLTYVDTRE